MQTDSQHPYRSNGIVLVLLLLLLGIAVAIHYLPPFSGKSEATLLVSGLKTALVVWYFMRGRTTRGATVFYMCAGLVWLSLLMLLTLADYLTR